jgi:uncharacterized protein
VTEPPTGVALETAWLVEATYAPDAAETRGPFRAEHLAGVARKLADGTFVLAGAFTDVTASLVIVRAASEEEALAEVRDDVYLRNGVWVELRARPFTVVTAGGSAD